MLRLTGPAYCRCAVGLAARLVIVSAVLAWVPPADAEVQRGSCLDPRAFGRVLSESRWTQRGSTLERRELPATPGGYSQLVRVEEQGVDVEIEVLDRAGSVVAQSDSPVERSVVQYAYLPAAAGGAATLVVMAKEPAGLEGTVRTTVFAVDAAADAPAPPEASTACAAALHHWAEADMSYARGRAVTVGRVTADAGTARTAFENAGRAYRAAREALQGSAHASERGLLELDLAALAYYGLKDWSGSAAWSATAAATFATTHEPYRRARAQAIQAAALIELATKSAAVDRTANTPRPARAQFAAARALLTALAQLHAARREWYDRALQINNIGLAYTYESRFEDAC